LQIRVLKIVPPILLFLAKSPIVSEFDLTSVHIIFSGAAPAGADLCEELKRRHPTIQHIAQGYGMTEMTVATHLPVLDKERHESTGKLAANLEMKAN
jgi:4-coumarate--CoA ligase